MAQYLFLFKGKESEPGDTSPETQEYARKWTGWMAGLAQSGALQSGSPLEWNGKTVSREGTDELRLESFDVGGFLVVNAASVEEAAEMAKQAPNVALGGQVVIRPCLEVPS